MDALYPRYRNRYPVYRSVSALKMVKEQGKASKLVLPDSRSRLLLPAPDPSGRPCLPRGMVSLLLRVAGFLLLVSLVAGQNLTTGMSKTLWKVGGLGINVRQNQPMDVQTVTTVAVAFALRMARSRM